MKNIIVLITLTCLFLSCKSDDGMDTPNHLRTEDAQKLIPLSSYNIASRVIFKNQDGVEKSLTISITETVEESMINDFQYTFDQLVIILIDEATTDYKINVIATATYSSIGSHIEFLNCILFNNQTSNGSIIPSIRIETNREPIVGTFEQEVQLLDKTFNDVYTNYDYSEVPAYSILHYTTQFGVIGFKDQSGILWVYDRME